MYKDCTEDTQDKADKDNRFEDNSLQAKGHWQVSLWGKIKPANSDPGILQFNIRTSF